MSLQQSIIGASRGSGAPRTAPSYGGLASGRHNPLTFSWLERLVLSAGLEMAGAKIPPSVSVSDEEVVEQTLHETLPWQYRERVFPIVHAYAKARGWGWADQVEPCLNLIRSSNEILLKQLRGLVRLLNETEVPVMLIKGADLMLSVYPRGIPRIMDDIDILIRPPDLPRAIEVFGAAGFVQGSVDMANLRVIPAESVDLTVVMARHYELPPFLQFFRTEHSDTEQRALESFEDEQFVLLGSDLYYLAEYDVHFNVSPDVEVRDLWNDIRRYELAPNVEVVAQNVSDLLWLLGVRGYERIAAERPAAMRSFLDVLVLLATREHEVNWRRLVAMTRKYQVQPPLYYLLWHVRELLGGFVPDEVVDELYPAADGVSRVHDTGDVTQKLFRTVHVQPWVR